MFWISGFDIEPEKPKFYLRLVIVLGLTFLILLKPLVPVVVTFTGVIRARRPVVIVRCIVAAVRLPAPPAVLLIPFSPPFYFYGQPV
jgi:hypothetical protein